MKLNNNIILPALVIFLIFISSCTNQVDILLSECNGLQDTLDKNYCYADIAAERKDASICNKLEDKNICYSSVAIRNQDEIICEKIQNQSERNICFSSIASLKSDLLICDKIQEQNDKDGCYEVIAENKQDSEICDKIHYQSNREECYYYIAGGLRDVKLCDKIQNKSLIEDCYNFVYSFVAEEKDDISICNKITDWSKGTCYGNIAFGRQNSSFCRVKDQSVQAGCYIVLAGRTNDLSFCDKIENESLVGECYGHLSLYFSSQGAGYDISSCEELKSIISKDSCYLFIAEAKQDANVCENIANQNLKEECQVEVKMINSN